MRITESQLRRIIRQEVRSVRSGRRLREALSERLEVAIMDIIATVHPPLSTLDDIRTSMEMGDAEGAKEGLMMVLDMASERGMDVEVMDVSDKLATMSDSQFLDLLARVPEFEPEAPAAPRSVSSTWAADSAAADQENALVRELLGMSYDGTSAGQPILPYAMVSKAVRSPSNKQQAILAQAIRDAGYDLDPGMMSRVTRGIVSYGSRASYRRAHGK